MRPLYAKLVSVCHSHGDSGQGRRYVFVYVSTGGADTCVHDDVRIFPPFVWGSGGENVSLVTINRRSY